MLISLISAFLALKCSSCQACLSFLHENLMRWFLLLYAKFLNFSEAACGSRSASAQTGLWWGGWWQRPPRAEFTLSCTVSHGDGHCRGPWSPCDMGAPAFLLLLMCSALALLQAARPKPGSPRKGAERLLMQAGPCGDPSSRSRSAAFCGIMLTRPGDKEPGSHRGLTAPDSPIGVSSLQRVTERISARHRARMAPWQPQEWPHPHPSLPASTWKWVLGGGSQWRGCCEAPGGQAC